MVQLLPLEPSGKVGLPGGKMFMKCISLYMVGAEELQVSTMECRESKRDTVWRFFTAGNQSKDGRRSRSGQERDH